MSQLPLTLVILAAFIHATWNLLFKRAAAAGPTFVFAYNLFACIVYLRWMIWLLVYGNLTWSFPDRGYTVVDGYGVKILGIHPVVLDWVTNLLRFFILAPIALSNWARTKEKMKGHWLLAFWVGALSPLSYILVLSAIEMGAPLSLVALAREMSMMAGALFGMLFLGERVTAWRAA